MTRPFFAIKSIFLLLQQKGARGNTSSFLSIQRYSIFYSVFTSKERPVISAPEPNQLSPSNNESAKVKTYLQADPDPTNPKQ